jgi:hypothetical protein
MGLEQDFRRHLVSYLVLIHAASNTAVRAPSRSVFVSLADIVPINFLDVTISVGNGVSGDSRPNFRGPTPAARSVVASLRPGGPSAHEYRRALKDWVALAATVTHQSGNSHVAMIPVRHALAVRRPRRNATQSPRIASVKTP